MASTNKYIAGGVANFLAAVCSNDDSSKVSNDVKKLSNLFREPVQRKKVSPDVRIYQLLFSSFSNLNNLL